MIYKTIIADKKTNKLREVQSAEQHLIKLSISKETSQLIEEIECGFNLEKGSLSPECINDVHLNPNKSKRSRSVIVTLELHEI